jgi:hypothetical protein
MLSHLAVRWLPAAVHFAAPVLVGVLGVPNVNFGGRGGGEEQGEAGGEELGGDYNHYSSTQVRQG